LRAPVVSRKTKVIAAALAAPFVVFVVAGLIVYGPAPGFAFITGLIILPIGLAVWLGVRAGRVTDTVLKTRARPLPALPEELQVVEDPSFDLASTDLPLFSRPLANLWSRSGPRGSVAVNANAWTCGSRMFVVSPSLTHGPNGCPSMSSSTLNSGSRTHMR
jgi:hypothetical protein